MLELVENKFFNKFDVLRQKGLHSPLVINEKLMRHEDYFNKLREAAKETSHISSMKGFPIGKVLLQTFENLFYFKDEVNPLFVNKPTFAKYSKAGDIYHNVMKIKIPDEETWEKWCDLL